VKYFTLGHSDFNVLLEMTFFPFPGSNDIESVFEFPWGLLACRGPAPDTRLTVSFGDGVSGLQSWCGTDACKRSLKRLTSLLICEEARVTLTPYTFYLYGICFRPNPE